MGRFEESNLPLGWERIPFRKACRTISLTGIKVKQKDYKQYGRYPIIDQGQKLIGGYWDNDELLVPEDPPFILFGDHTQTKKIVNFRFVAGGDGLKVIKPNDCFIPKLFYYFIHVIQIPDKGYARHFQYLKKSDVMLPPLAEQYRIVGKIDELFSEIDKGIENLQTAKEQLEVYRQAVLKAAFEGELTSDWRTRNSIFHDTNQWETGKLERVADVSGGITKNAKKNANKPLHPYLRVANVYANKLDLTDVQYIGADENEYNRTLLEKGDLLFVEGNGSKTQIGRVAIWNGEIKGCLHQNHIIKARPLEKLLSKYCMYFFLSREGRSQIEAVAATTSGLYTLSITKIKNLELSIPSLEEQHQIVQEIESRLSVCEHMEEAIEKGLVQAESLKQSILKKAFKGRLVPQDPDDERQQFYWSKYARKRKRGR